VITSRLPNFLVAVVGVMALVRHQSLSRELAIFISKGLMRCLASLS